MRRSVLASLLAALAACVVPADGASPDGVGSSADAIVNGERTNMNEQAVVGVINRFGGLCTGTLIAPRVVLTAKHCVQSAGAEAPGAPGAFFVGIGDSIRNFTETYNVAEITTTPGVYTDRGGLRGALVGVDVATILLARPVTGIRPVPIYRGNPRDIMRGEFRAVGFGQIPSGQAGVKYRTDTRVNSLDAGVIYTPPTICQGDSGGPLYHVTDEGTDEVVGVASFGTGACGSGINGYNRIDAFLDLIDAAVRASGECVGNEDDEEICDGFDNNCNGLIDEDCAEVGEACEADDECITLLCRDGLCTQRCDPLRPYTGCPVDFYCQGSGCEGLCAAGSAGTLAIDERCADDTECASLFCHDPGDGIRRCLDPCRTDEGTCVSGDVCFALPGSCGGCVPAELASVSRGIGEPCDADEECREMRCHVEEGHGRCTRACALDRQCPAGYHCRRGESEGLCIVGERGGVGSACVANGDCDEMLFCAARGDVRWCTNFCEDAEEDCPPDFTCSEVGPDTRICVPNRGTMGARCEVPEDCISGVCEAPGGGEGPRECTRQCSGEAQCPPGFLCTRGANGAQCERALRPEMEVSGGGCSAGGSTHGTGWLLAAALLGWCSRRRR